MSDKLEAWKDQEGELKASTRLRAVDLGREGAADAEALRADLEKHVREEEQPDGFFEELVKLNPANASHVEELRAEHAGLLADLGQLTAALKEGADAEELTRRRDDLVQRLRAHRQAEQKILQDTYLRDEGGGS
jgi:hypothetical protein